MHIRIIKFLVLIGFILTALTGVRIWLFHSSFQPTAFLNWLDPIQLGGNIFNQHRFLGYVLLGLVILLALYGSWQFLRMKHVILAAGAGWLMRKSLLFSIYTFLGALVLSGLLIDSGRIVDILFYATIKNMHTYSFYGLIVLGLLYGAVLFVYRNARRQSGYLKAGSAIVDLLVLVLIIGLSGYGSILIFRHFEKPNVYMSKSIFRSPVIDGQVRGFEWVGVDSVSLIVSGGDNFPDKLTQLKMKSFHNHQYIFFVFQWPDSEPSFNKLIVKSDSGWKELKSESSPFGESVYFEDQLAVYFSEVSSSCAQSCHLGGTMKVGNHYTTGDTADIWIWKSVSTNPAFDADDGWWSDKLNDSSGGTHLDNSPGGGYISNLNQEWDEPYFLPTRIPMENCIRMESDIYYPYRAGLDNFAIGSTLPGVLVSKHTGDRADIYARGQCRNGLWTVELSRRKNTGSSFDVTLRTEAWLGLAVFNNAEIKHAYHIKPIKFMVEK